MSKTKTPHGTRVGPWDAERNWYDQIPLTESDVRERIAQAVGKGANYARVHVTAPRSIAFYRYDSASPSGRRRVGPLVPNTPANHAIVREMLREEPPGSSSVVRGTQPDPRCNSVSAHLTKEQEMGCDWHHWPTVGTKCAACGSARVKEAQRTVEEHTKREAERIRTEARDKIRQALTVFGYGPVRAEAIMRDAGL